MMLLQDLCQMSGLSIRWMIYGAAIALTLIGIRVAEDRDGESTPARVQIHATRNSTAGVAPPELARIPKLELERLTLRTQRDTGPDPFNARSWDALATEEAGRDAPPPQVPPPQAPPLPFTFLGKLIDGEHITVFLTAGDRNWVVRAGDTIDGAYRVEAIGDEKMTLTHLALGIPRELAIGERTPRPEARRAASVAEALPTAETAPARALLPGQVPVLLAAPLRAAAGNELVVSVGLPRGNGARTARVELAYDAKVLAAVDAPSHDAGRLTVELADAASPSARLRFRVIAQSPTTTRIGVASASATDQHGGSLPLVVPNGQNIAIVQTGR